MTLTSNTMTISNWTAALCQMSSVDDIAVNLARAGQLIDDAAAAGARLICLPEVFSCIGDTVAKRAAAQPDTAASVAAFLATCAREHGVFIAGGSIHTPGKQRIRNRSLLYGPTGQELGRYDKIHLFRFHGPDRSYDEAEDYEPGNEVVTVDTALGVIGLSICYDLRFPELYRQMRTPDVVLVPAAFTRQTGRAHWQPLLRARAMENQCYVLGTAQCGAHPGGILTWGHSLAVDPWGKTLGKLGEDPGILLVNIDQANIAATRARLPVLDNRML